jgi:hypothetical protein
VFGLAGLAHEVLAEVPVGAVQNAHLAVILMKNNPATLPVHTGRSKYSMGRHCSQGRIRTIASSFNNQEDCNA